MLPFLEGILSYAGDTLGIANTNVRPLSLLPLGGLVTASISNIAAVFSGATSSRRPANSMFHQANDAAQSPSRELPANPFKRTPSAAPPLVIDLSSPSGTPKLPKVRKKASVSDDEKRLVGDYRYAWQSSRTSKTKTNKRSVPADAVAIPAPHSWFVKETETPRPATTRPTMARKACWKPALLSQSSRLTSHSQAPTIASALSTLSLMSTPEPVVTDPSHTRNSIAPKNQSARRNTAGNLHTSSTSAQLQ